MNDSYQKTVSTNQNFANNINTESLILDKEIYSRDSDNRRGSHESIDNYESADVNKLFYIVRILCYYCR